MEEEKILTRFVLGGRHFYFQTSWRDTDFEINITDGRQVWHGHAQEEFIENALKPGEMELQEYMQLTKRALTVQDVTKKHFSYRLSQGQSPTELQLTWRIKLGHDSQVGFSVKGTLPLTMAKDGRPVIQQCLDSLIDRQTVLEKSNRELRTENESLFAQRDNALSQLNLLVQEKKAMELDLYHKFVQVLNEKKKKIRELKSRGEEKALTSTTTESVGGAVHQSDEEDSRWPLANPTSRSGPAVPDEPGCNESEDEEDPHQGTFSLHGPTPSLSLLGSDGEYTIRTSVRKRHRPVPHTDRDSAPSTATAATSLKEKLLMASSKTTETRKWPDAAGTDGRNDTFARPTKKARTESGRTGSPSGKPTTKASTSAATRAAKRTSVSAEDLLDMCQ